MPWRPPSWSQSPPAPVAPPVSPMSDPGREWEMLVPVFPGEEGLCSQGTQTRWWARTRAPQKEAWVHTLPTPLRTLRATPIPYFRILPSPPKHPSNPPTSASTTLLGQLTIPTPLDYCQLPSSLFPIRAHTHAHTCTLTHTLSRTLTPGRGQASGRARRTAGQRRAQAGLSRSHVGAAQTSRVASEETGHPFPLGLAIPSGNVP